MCPQLILRTRLPQLSVQPIQHLIVRRSSIQTKSMVRQEHKVAYAYKISRHYWTENSCTKAELLNHTSWQCCCCTQPRILHKSVQNVNLMSELDLVTVYILRVQNSDDSVEWQLHELTCISSLMLQWQVLLKSDFSSRHCAYLPVRHAPALTFLTLSGVSPWNHYNHEFASLWPSTRPVDLCMHEKPMQNYLLMPVDGLNHIKIFCKNLHKNARNFGGKFKTLEFLNVFKR